MAGTSLKLVNKLNRRNKKVKEHARGFDRFDEVFLNPKTLAESPRAYELMRQAERRRERAFGQFGVGQKPVLHQEYVSVSLGRHDFGSSDYGMQLTLSAAQIGFQGSGVQVGDCVEVTQQDSVAYGQYLKVVALTSSTQLRLTDFPGAATGAVAQIETVTTAADSAGSLNSKDWYINSEANATQYYVWYNVSGGGTDPAVGGKTAIPVAITTGATAAAVASATATAMNAVSGHPWTAVATGGSITVTWNTPGPVTAPTNGGASPSFTFTQVQAGAATNPTPTAETNVTVRLEANVVKSYY